jgi:cytoskeleton protein RodZ
MRGISLDEISHATKIGTRLLKALEDEDFQKLPGGIFNKGFVRAYAKFLGIDEDEAVTDYAAVAGEDLRTAVDPDQLRHAAERKLSEQRAQAVRDASEGRQGAVPLWLPVVAFLLLSIALVAGGVQLYRRNSGHIRESVVDGVHRLENRLLHGKANPQSQQNQAAVTSTSVSPTVETSAQQQQAAPAPASVGSGEQAGSQSGTSPASVNGASPISGSMERGAEPGSVSAAAIGNKTGNTELKPASQSDGEEFAVSIRALQASWVSIVADGDPPIRRMLRPGSPEALVKAHGKVKLTAGNAGAIEISVDGKPQPSIGEENQVRTVYVTASGVQP